MEHRAKLAGLALMFAALGAQALTLGRVRGAAVIGRPLDVGGAGSTGLPG